VSGKVYEKKKQRGDFVREGDVLAVIGDASFLYAKVNVDESNISKVKIGQEAVVKLNTNKTKQYKGVVGEILPSFDQNNQSFYCKIFFSDSLDFKIAGTQLEANIIINDQKNALLIPRNFINYDGTVLLKGIAEPKRVITNFVGTEWVHIISGVKDGDIVITTNVLSKKSGDSVPGILPN
jgi:multidrug efflux pump subunit AcrA (membrane-fusion protein)